MKTRSYLMVLCLALGTSLLVGTSLAQYTPSFEIDTIAAAGAYDVQGTAVGGDGTVYLLDPVCDQVLNVTTGGTLIRSFPTEAFGCHDGQGLAANPVTNVLYIVDPVCDQVFTTTTDGVLLGSFGTEAFGCHDAMDVAFDPANGELYLLDPICDRIWVTSDTGVLDRFLSTEAFGSHDAQGIAFDPARRALLVVDPVCNRVVEVSAASGNPYREVDTEAYGLFDIRSAGFLAPSTLVVTDPICDVNRGLVLPVDLATHDIGNIVMTMTDQGSLGFLDDTQVAGSGIIYPAGQPNLLYVGSLWVGGDASYVANRDYSADPAEEWTIASDPGGGVQVQVPGANADQEIHAGFDNSLTGGGVSPFDLYVRQESWAYSDPSDDDFVIVRYFIHNRGSQNLTDLYAGVFLDVDINPFGSNTGVSDAARQAVVMTGAGGTHLGAALLEGDANPDPLANLTFVPNPIFVYPQTYMLDADKFGFLSASDPAHTIPDAPTPDDYSLLVSAGPFSLAPGDSNEVAFAIAGGTDLATFYTNIDRAQDVYSAHTISVAETSPELARASRLISIAPNPFNPTTTIRYDLAAAGAVRLQIYDAQGHVVRSLVDGQLDSGRHEQVWDGRGNSGHGVASGVYFVRLEAPGTEQSERIVLVK